MKKFLFLLIGIFLLSLSPVFGVQEINECITIGDWWKGKYYGPGEYELGDEFDTPFVFPGHGYTNFVCINIVIDNVTLDCKGRTISGETVNPDGYTYAIRSTGKNTTIKKCVISNWDFGIYFTFFGNKRIEEGTIAGNTLSSNRKVGIHVENGDRNSIIHNAVSQSKVGIAILGNENTIEYNTVTENDNGIAILGDNNVIDSNTITLNKGPGGFDGWGILSTITWKDSDIQGDMNNNDIVNNKIEDNENGIYLVGRNNKINTNKIQSNKLGIYLQSTQTGTEGPVTTEGNLIYNNLFNNIINFNFNGVLGVNSWNIEPKPGENIKGVGDYLGGNYWGSNGYEKGFSENCVNEGYNGDCLCTPFDLTGDGKNVDNYPLTYWCKCPERCCNGNYNVSYKSPWGLHICDAFPKYCKYENKETCPIDATSSEAIDPPIHPEYFTSIYKTDLLDVGECTDHMGCADGFCVNEEYKDYCYVSPDLNDDGIVDIIDITMVAIAFGSNCNEDTCREGYSCYTFYEECDHKVNWKPTADINKDGKVDIIDIALIAKDFGNKISPEYLDREGRLVEYSSYTGSCTSEVLSCANHFTGGEGLYWEGWECKSGKCVGCEKDSDCYKYIKYPEFDEEGKIIPGLECYITECEDECNGKGQRVYWYCDKDSSSETRGYCLNRNNQGECTKPVDEGKICIDGREVPVTGKDQMCGDESLIDYIRCPGDLCKGQIGYPACDGDKNGDGYGQCTDHVYKDEFAVSGQILDSHCKSTDGSCGSSLGCYLETGTVSCSKGKNLLACNGETGGGKCEYDLQTWDQQSLVSCNGHKCTETAEGENVQIKDDICDTNCGASSDCNGKKTDEECGVKTITCSNKCDGPKLSTPKYPTASSTIYCSSNCKCNSYTEPECKYNTASCVANACPGAECSDGSTQPCKVGDCCPGTDMCDSNCQWSCNYQPDSSLCDQRAECVGCYCVG